MRDDYIVKLGKDISDQETLPTITDLRQVRNQQYLNKLVTEQTRQRIYALSLIALGHFVKAHFQVEGHIQLKAYENHK
jgi:hypothetical protein